MTRTLSPVRLTLEAQGIPLRLWDYGGGIQPVLFLHGHLDTGRSFEGVVERLPETVRALTLDWRGHGESGLAPAGASYHALDHLKDLVQIIDRLGELDLHPAAVIGHSFGGIIATLLAGTLPDLCSRYLFIDVLGPLSETADEQPARLESVLSSIREPKKPFQTFPTKEAAIARVRFNNPGLTEAGAARMVEFATRRREDGQWGFLFDARLRGPTPVRYTEEMWLALCRRITAKVLVLGGSKGYLERIPGMRKRLDTIADARLVMVPEAHHHLHLDFPQDVANAAVQLLDN